VSLQNIDGEIRELELRLAQRRLKVELLARASKRRALGSLASPAGLIGAAALGFLTAAGVVGRQRHFRASPAGRGRFGGILGFAMSAGTTLALAFVRARFGGPAQLAQLLLAKVYQWKNARQDAAPGRR